MEPIISPWFIYLLGVVSNLGVVLCVLLVALGLAGCISGAAGFFMRCDGDDGAALAIKVAKTAVTWFCILLVIAVFIPSERHIIGMIVANNITYERAETILKNGKTLKEELKRDAIDVIMALRDEEKEE